MSCGGAAAGEGWRRSASAAAARSRCRSRSSAHRQLTWNPLAAINGRSKGVSGHKWPSARPPDREADTAFWTEPAEAGFADERERVPYCAFKRLAPVMSIILNVTLNIPQ